jgi:hypothetical protein
MNNLQYAICKVNVLRENGKKNIIFLFIFLQ